VSFVLIVIFLKQIKVYMFARVKQLLLQPLPLIVLLAVLQLLVALPQNHLNFDEAMWQYIGRNWFRNGLVPYTGGVDNKSPAIFAVFGLSDFLFGLNCWFPRVLGTIFQSAGVYYIYRIARHLAGEKAAIFSTTLYGLSLLWKSTDGESVSFTETYAVAFIILSFFCSITSTQKKGFFWSGVLAAIGVAFRFSAFFGIGAIVIYLMTNNKKGLLLFVPGLILGVLSVAAIFLLAGVSLHDIAQYCLTENFTRGSVTDHPFSWRLEGFMRTFFYSEIILFYPFVAAFLLLKKKFYFLFVWLLCEFLGISVIGTFATTHFKNILPPLSLMSGIAIAFLTERYGVPARALLIITWLVFFPKILNPLVNMKRLFSKFPQSNAALCNPPYQQADEYDKKALGLWIRQNTSPTDKVYVAGYGAIVQAYSCRQSPTVYFNETQTEAAKQRLLADLRNNAPAMIVVPAWQLDTPQDNIATFVDALLKSNYTFSRCCYGYGIYLAKAH
jgi:Dolichyl-phosphate-mannose-protein mannosyltransferase